MQGSLLLGSATSAGSTAVADGFCATRLDAECGWGAVFGTGSAKLDATAVLNRAWSDQADSL
jgi:hypothetical protein